jgi:hypothetical protein
MKLILFHIRNKKWKYPASRLVMILGLTILFLVSGLYSVFGVELFSEDDKPFGISQTDWLSKYWNWWVAISPNEVVDIKENGGCLINIDGSVVMLAELTLEKVKPVLECDISSKQAVLVPLWIAWCDSGNDADYNINPPEKSWAECARERYNTGHIKSEARLDENIIAKMDVYSFPDKSKNNIVSLNNVTEIYGTTTDFSLTLPKENHKQLKSGTFVAGSQGWIVFLKPLSPGKHELFYSNTVLPIEGITSTVNEAEIKYVLNVK